jgi:hypothetical protein
MMDEMIALEPMVILPARAFLLTGDPWGPDPSEDHLFYFSGQIVVHPQVVVFMGGHINYVISIIYIYARTYIYILYIYRHIVYVYM